MADAAEIAVEVGHTIAAKVIAPPPAQSGVDSAANWPPVNVGATCPLTVAVPGLPCPARSKVVWPWCSCHVAHVPAERSSPTKSISGVGKPASEPASEPASLPESEPASLPASVPLSVPPDELPAPELDPLDEPPELEPDDELLELELPPLDELVGTGALRRSVEIAPAILHAVAPQHC
jgi:hypothetical protein